MPVFKEATHINIKFLSVKELEASGKAALASLHFGSDEDGISDFIYMTLDKKMDKLTWYFPMVTSGKVGNELVFMLGKTLDYIKTSQYKRPYAGRSFRVSTSGVVMELEKS